MKINCFLNKQLISTLCGLSLAFGAAFSVGATEVTALADFAKSMNDEETARTGTTFIQQGGGKNELGLAKFDITTHGIPNDATIISATLYGTTKAVYGDRSWPSFAPTDLKTQAEIDLVVDYADYTSLVLGSSVSTPAALEDSDGEEQEMMLDVTDIVKSSVLDSNQDLVILTDAISGSAYQLFTYGQAEVDAGQNLRIVINYTSEAVPAGTALLTPSHILMVAKGGNSASDGGIEQTFTLSNSATTTSAVVYTSATTTFTNTAAPFSLDDSNCTNKTLYEGQSCEITLLLDPDVGLDADKAGLVQVTTDVGTSVAYVSQFESLAEQAERRLPPAAYDVLIKLGGTDVGENPDLAPGSYNVRFDLESYYSDYNVWLAIYECTPTQISNESCGTGTPLVSKELSQTVLSGSTNYTGKSTFNVAPAVSYTIPASSKIGSLKHKFTTNITIPTYDEAGAKLIARLFYREGIDSGAGNRAVSVIFSGAHLHGGGVDTLGRKIIISQ